MTGIALFILGGLVGALFPACFKKVRGWHYECYWFTFVIFGLFLVPLTYGVTTIPHFFDLLGKITPQVLLRCVGFGLIWGAGSLCFGLTLRYLGVGLAVVLVNGICAAFGTLLPPIVKGQVYDFVKDLPAQITFGSVFVMLFGIVLVGLAAASKDQELSEEEKKKTIPEYHFATGMIMALIAGLASAAMNFGLQSGDSTMQLALDAGANPIWKGIPVMFLVMFGGVLTNSIWSIRQLLKNGTWRDYFDRSKPLAANYFWAGILPGLLWAIQPISLKMGEPMMGEAAYIGFAVVMGTAFLTGVLIGIFSGEWHNVRKKTSAFLYSGLFFLLLSAFLTAFAQALAK